MAGLAGIATAGDYHVGTLLVCSDCHVMHGSAAYASTADSTGPGSIFIEPGLRSPTGGPYEYLLRGQTVNNACLTCHDQRTDVADVLGGTTSTSVPNGRAAGALNVGEAGHGYTTADYAPETGHSLWSTDPPPGLVGTNPIGDEGLECSDCHSVHGNKNYRNMNLSTTSGNRFYNKTVTYEIGGTTTNVDVFETHPHDYDNANVNYGEPSQSANAYGAWCGSCHGEFHGAPGASPIAFIAGSDTTDVRHPTAGIDISSSRVNRWKIPDLPTHRLKLADLSHTWDGTNLTTMSPSCYTCHKSHGNQNRFGLIFVVPNQASNGPTADPTRLASMTEEGDGGRLRDLCRNCHSSGTFPTGNPTNIWP
jgi:hypothetical protein